MAGVAPLVDELPWDRPKPDPDDLELFPRPRYLYLGKRGVLPELIGGHCDPVRRPDGKCIVGSGPGPRNALVLFAGESIPRVVPRRLLKVVNP